MKIFYGGDVNVGRRMNFKVGEIEQFIGLDEMAAADLRVVNLECVIATKGTQGIDKGEEAPTYLRARPEQTNILTKAGVDVVLTANSHAGDYGSEALLEQREYLDTAGISYVGSGKNISEAFAPIYKKVGDITVAIFNVDSTMKFFAATDKTPGIAYLPPDKPQLWKKSLADKFREAHEKADVVIVAVHWGEFNVAETSAQVKQLGHLLIDLGADAVLGSHSYLIHGVENYKERPIIYDAGIFLFDVLGKARNGGCFTLEISAAGVEKINFIPLIVGCGQTIKADAEQATEINENFIGLCNEFGTSATTWGGGSVVEISFNPPPRESKIIDNSAAVEVSERHLIEPLTEPRPEWIIDKVPDDAIIEPQNFGALKLVGYHVPPKSKILDKRKLLYVETYWTITEPLDKNCLLSIMASPLRECKVPPFGRNQEHEFCDYMFPVNRWKVGVIYREKYGLRPPEKKWLANVDLQVEIKVRAGEEILGEFKPSDLVKIRRPLLPYYSTEFDEIIYKYERGKLWTAEQLAKVTGGTWSVPMPEGWYVNSFSTINKATKVHISKTRPTLMLTSLFTDRNSCDFSKKILDNIKNLAGVMATPKDIKGLPKDFPVLKVSNVKRAVWRLFIAARQRFKGKVIAVTGSSGKTTTCNMLKGVLGKDHKIAPSPGSNMYHVVPLNFSRVSPNAKFAIVELSVDVFRYVPGSICYDLIPNVAVVTSIAPIHVSKFAASMEEIAEQKSRIFCGMPPGSYVVLNRDMPYYETFEQKANALNLKIITFGTHPESTVRMANLVNGGEFSVMGKTYQLNCPVPTDQLYDALATIGVALAVNIPVEKALAELKNFKIVSGRGNVIKVNRGGKKIKLIDSTFNANPLSMKYALEHLKNIEPNQESRVAVLGDIASLGVKSVDYHKELADAMLDAEPDRILLCGKFMRYPYEMIKDKLNCTWYATLEELLKGVESHLRDGDTVLVKSSHATGLSKVISLLSK